MIFGLAMRPRAKLQMREEAFSRPTQPTGRASPSQMQRTRTTPRPHDGIAPYPTEEPRAVFLSQECTLLPAMPLDVLSDIKAPNHAHHFRAAHHWRPLQVSLKKQENSIMGGRVIGQHRI